MAIRTTITLTCDVCGKHQTIEKDQTSERIWRHEVWVRLKIPYRESPVLALHEMDVCDDCMMRQTVLAGEADSTVEVRNVRNIHFVEDES